jgi:hypothetical protein
MKTLFDMLWIFLYFFFFSVIAWFEIPLEMHCTSNCFQGPTQRDQFIKKNLLCQGRVNLSQRSAESKSVKINAQASSLFAVQSALA